MSILQQILTMFRGALTEVGQSVVDANAMRILDQEIREAQAALWSSREDLTRIMAQRKLLEDKLKDRAAKKAEYEGYIRQLLAKNNRALATEVAGKLAILETDMVGEQQSLAGYEQSIASLRVSIQQAETTVSRLKQQVDTVKATESVQRAQASIAARHSGTSTKLRTALDSLDRLKEQQSLRGAQLEAANQLSLESGDGALQARLAQAGIMQDSSSVDAVLLRFEKEQQLALSHDSAPQLSHEPASGEKSSSHP